ncbi:MAG: GNAT family N-acetyltransferase [bacterium]|nr:GNAT family N-acetyltransferase [bacterium]
MNADDVTPPVSLPDGAQLTVMEPERFSLALDCLETAFPNVRRSFFHAITLQDPNYSPKFSLAAEKDERVLAFVQIFDREMMFEGERVRFGGIGSVGTRPSHRGRGYARALLKRAIEVMDETGMAGSMLFTKIHPFYEELGWRTIEQYEQEIPIQRLKRGAIHFDQRRPMRDEDLPEIMKLAVLPHNQPPSGTLTRSETFWRRRGAWMNHPATVVKNDGAIHGYFWSSQYNPEEPALSLSEYGVREPNDQTYGALFAAMAEKAVDARCDRLRGPFKPLAAPYDFVTRHDLIDKTHVNRYMMWRDANGHTRAERMMQAARDGRFLYWPTDAF